MNERISFLPGVVVALLLTACGTSLQVLDAENSQLMHPWLEERATKAAVIKRLGDSWIYVDSLKRIYVYPAGPATTQSDGENSDTEQPDPVPVYELVLTFDEHEQLNRYSIIRVK